MTRWVYMGLAIAVGSLVAACGCTKESPDKAKSPEVPAVAEPAADDAKAPAPAPPPEPDPPIAALPTIELAGAAPAGDRYMILFRFDHLRTHGLSAAAESIIAPLPDYLRTFGARDPSEHGDLIANVFETVVLTTVDPSALTATTLAAHGPFKPKTMRKMLAYKASGLAWSNAIGGQLGTITPGTRFGWDEPRVFLMPAPQWIMLAHPDTLNGLAAPVDSSNRKKRKRERLKNVEAPGAEAIKAWPGWMRQVLETDRQSRISTPELGDLLVTANIHGLEQMSGPLRFGQFDVPTPKDVTITAFAHANGVRFQGSMKFDEEANAERFVKVAKGSKFALEMKDVVAVLPPGSLEPLKKMTFYRDGRLVRWKTRATVAETEKMCAFSAAQAARLMGAPVP